MNRQNQLQQLIPMLLVALLGIACGLIAPAATSTPAATATSKNTPRSAATSTPIPPTATPMPPTPTPFIPEVVEDVPKVEEALIRDVTEQGVLNRFNIPELIPGPGIAEGGVVFSEGASGTIKVSTEFPGDILILGGGLGITLQEPLELHGEISLQEDAYNVRIHRFRGKVPIASGYVFIGEGDDLNLLTFVRLPDLGYVYLRGKGQVILPNGDVVKLGY